MAFRSVNFAHLAKFNSDASSKFVEFYEGLVRDKIIAKNSEVPHRAFSPSSFRCSRKQWFRLRGVEPDTLPKPDPVLNFTAEIGTACHTIIQNDLVKGLGEDWIDVADYLQEHPIPYKYTISKDGDDRPSSEFETRVEIIDPPIRFACDGIMRWLGQYYLLEIKTSEFSSFDKLTDPKPIHVDQVKFYATLLGLDKVLFLYMDRQYGGVKSYELIVTETDKRAVMAKVEQIQKAVKDNLAPERLPTRQVECSLNSCPYYKKCMEWG